MSQPASRPPQATLTIDTPSVAFGTRMIQTTSTTNTITIKNTSGHDATNCVAPGVNLVGSNSFFVGATTCTSTLKAKSSCTVTVYSKLNTVGSNKGQLYFACGNTGKVTSDFTGTGTAMLTFSATFLNFAQAFVGINSATQTLTITNNSSTSSATGCTAPQLLTSTGATSTEFTITNDTCGTNDIPAGSSCSMTVAATPSSIGLKTVFLSKTCTRGGGLFLTPLISFGVQLLSSVASLNFTAVINQSTAAQVITIVNVTGVSATGCSTPTLSGTNPSEFTYSPVSSCTNQTTLATNSACSILVSASPTSYGDKSATITYHCTGANSISIPLTATVASTALIDKKQNILRGGPGKDVFLWPESTPLKKGDERDHVINFHPEEGDTLDFHLLLKRYSPENPDLKPGFRPPNILFFDFDGDGKKVWEVEVN